MDRPEQTSPTDTQWPRWEVFKQDAPSRPHQAVGSVHAVDAEHALLAARSVFARRPSAVSLWVAPADAIFSVTAQELATMTDSGAADGGAEETGDAREPYLVFRKSSARQSLTFADHVGEVTAAGPREALNKAQEAFDDAPALAWWLVPERAVAKSRDEDAPAWFEPAKDKTYKQQSEYGMVGTHPGRRQRGRGA